jgi:transposase-like protein
MSENFEGLKHRLVVGHKRDGRSVYDDAAKAELVALCLQPGASVSRLSREYGVNANLVRRWLREHAQGGRRRTKGAQHEDRFFGLRGDAIFLPAATSACAEAAPREAAVFRFKPACTSRWPEVVPTLLPAQSISS